MSYAVLWVADRLKAHQMSLGHELEARADDELNAAIIKNARECLRHGETLLRSVKDTEGESHEQATES